MTVYILHWTESLEPEIVPGLEHGISDIFQTPEAAHRILMRKQTPGITYFVEAFTVSTVTETAD